MPAPAVDLVDAALQARRDDLLVLAAGRDFNPKFRDWLLSHFAIYAQFEQAADKVRARGIKEYSAFVIVNVLRYRADVSGIKFAMSNTLVPDMARLYNMNTCHLFKVSTRFAK